MVKKKTAKVLKYTVVFEPDMESGGYVVTVPSLPGCVTQGETFEEAVLMVKDAISGYLEVLREEGREIPKEPEEVVISKVEVFLPTPA